MILLYNYVITFEFSMEMVNFKVNWSQRQLLVNCNFCRQEVAIFSLHTSLERVRFGELECLLVLLTLLLFNFLFSRDPERVLLFLDSSNTLTAFLLLTVDCVVSFEILVITSKSTAVF